MIDVIENSAGEGNALREEMAVSLNQAHQGLQGMLVLLKACMPGTHLGPDQLHALLCPLADQVEQAMQMAGVMLAPQQQREQALLD